MKPDDFRVGLKLVATNTAMKGVPVKILCINLPFVVVEAFDGTSHTFDVRRSIFVRCTESYWRTITKLNPTRVKRKTSTTQDSDDVCPFCGGPVVERLIAPGTWALYCSECGGTGEIIR